MKYGEYTNLVDPLRAFRELSNGKWNETGEIHDWNTTNSASCCRVSLMPMHVSSKLEITTTTTATSEHDAKMSSLNDKCSIAIRECVCVLVCGSDFFELHCLRCQLCLISPSSLSQFLAAVVVISYKLLFHNDSSFTRLWLMNWKHNICKSFIPYLNCAQFHCSLFLSCINIFDSLLTARQREVE